MAKSSSRVRKVARKKRADSRVRKSAVKTKPKGAGKVSRTTSSGKGRRGSATASPKPKRGKQKPSQIGRPTETRKSIPAMQPTPAPETPPRLLRETKSTASALSLLEKAIKLLYYKDFRRARAELEALIENHPHELEIAAKARSYLQICNREEAGSRRHGTSLDQMYTLGIVEHNRGNYDAAIALFNQTLAASPGADYLFYSIAASCALKGDAGRALEHLRKAIGLNEANRIYARNDTDFISLYETREFADLVGMVLQPKAEPQL